jgi:F0F1-type ATP synthase assembly protein I
MPYNRPVSDSKSRKGSSSGIETLVQAEKLMQIAIMLPSAAVIGWLMGAWADSKLHTTWLSLVGIAFGGISGLVYVVRLVLATKANPDSAGNADSRKQGEGSDDTQ